MPAWPPAQLCPPPHRRKAGRAADPELTRLQSQRRILLKGGVVLTMDPQVGHFANADVLIEDGKIREVRPDIAASDVVTVDASNRIVIPGFIDTHSHSYQGILRNILPNGRVDPDYNRDIIAKITPAYTPQDAYIGMLATALGMIDMGTTGVVDVSQVNNTPEHSDALIKALQDSGIRAVFGYSAGAAGAAHAASAGHRASKAHLFQFQGPVADPGARHRPRSKDVPGGARQRRAGGRPSAQHFAAAGRRRATEGALAGRAAAERRRIHPPPAHAGRAAAAHQGFRLPRVALDRRSR